MPTIGVSIDVNVPAETAYDQWRQFEKLPQFIEVGKQVDPLDGNPLQRKTESWIRTQNGTPRSRARRHTTALFGRLNPEPLRGL